MSHNDELDHKMKKLGKKLKNMETKTSAQEIFQTVQQKNEKRNKHSVFPVIAASVVALLVGGVLFGSLFFTDEAGDNNDPQEIGTPADTDEEDRNDDTETEEEIEEEANPQEDSTEETTTEETTSDDEQQDESNEEDATEETTESDDTYLHREELITETVYPEGMKEDIRMRLITNEHLGYSSYVHEPMIYREQMENEKSVDYYYVDFAETGEIQYENSYIRVEKFEGQSVDEVVAAREGRIEQNGFTEQTIHEQIEGSSHHSMYTTQDLTHYLTIVESGNATFAVDSQMIKVMSDGTFPWIIDSFVQKMQFAE